ncbi:hypothetical protein D3C87_1934830 [compost metagenome]
MAGENDRSGKCCSSLLILAWIRWMLVDSSGSMNPLDRPMATTFLSHILRRRPVLNRSRRGSARGWLSRLAVSVATASSSEMKRLE